MVMDYPRRITESRPVETNANIVNMKRILLNALPMTVVGTGIGRYLRGLYGAIEDDYGDSFQVSYFNGTNVVVAPPRNEGAGWKERVGQLLWKMPYPIALGARLLRHTIYEGRFSRVCPGYDVYHEAGYFPFKTRGELKTILTVHDLSLLRYPQWHPKERVLYWKKFFHDRVGSVDSFCAVSEFTKREMVEHLSIDPDLIYVTPLGFDSAIFNETNDQQAQTFLEQTGLPDKYVLFVGSGDPRKNLDRAVDALQSAQTNLPLVVVGWSGWRDNESNVIPMGYVSDRTLAQLYRKAELLVMPSEYEGFGLPVLEAMACGCPVLASRAEALTEVGGSAVAYIEDTRDTLEFGKSLDNIINSRNFRESLSSTGTKRSRAFSWSYTAHETIVALQELKKT